MRQKSKYYVDYFVDSLSVSLTNPFERFANPCDNFIYLFEWFACPFKKNYHLIEPELLCIQTVCVSVQKKLASVQIVYLSIHKKSASAQTFFLSVRIIY